MLVLGDGGFGLMHAWLLALRGVRPVLAGRHDERLEIARAFGVQEIVNSRKADVRDVILALTDERGADALVECTGVQEVWESAPSLVRRGGTVSFFGGLPSNARVCFSAARLHYDEVRLISPFHFRPASVKRAYTLLTSGDVDPRPLLTGTAPLTQIATVFEKLDNGAGIKYAIEP